jgi:hypothetical protein
VGRVPLLLAVLAFLFFNGNNFLWLVADDRPLVWDHHSHYVRGLKFSYLVGHGHRLNIDSKGPAEKIQRFQEDHPALAYGLTSPLRGFVSFAQGLFMGPKHPPAVHTLAGVLVTLFGPNPDGVVFGVNLLFSGLLFLSVFHIALRFAGPWAAVLATWVVGLFPVHFLEAHVLMLDVPLSASVALAWFALLRTEGFKDRRASAWAGAALGFGWLVKETFPIFVLVPLIFSLRGPIREGREKGWKETFRKGRGANSLLTLCIGFLVCGFWFLPYLPRMPKVLLKHQTMGGMEMDPAWWEIEGALFYPCAMNNVQTSFLFMSALAVALILLLWRYRKHPWTLPLLLWIAIPWVLFTLLTNKDARYTVAVLPAVAILIGAGLTRFRVRSFAVAVSVLLVAMGVLQCLQINWGLFGPIPDVPLVRPPGEGSGPALYLFVPKTALRTRPHKTPKGARDLERLLRCELRFAGRKDKKTYEVRHLFDLPDMTAPVEQKFCRQNLDARFTGKGTFVNIRAGFFDPPRAFREADLLLVKRRGTLGALFRGHTRKAVEAFNAHRDRFIALGRFEGPDGFDIEAYIPKKEPTGRGNRKG